MAPQTPFASHPLGSREITPGCPRPPAPPVAVGTGGRGEDAAVGRREPLVLPGPPVMWLLTAQARNGSQFTAG